MDPSLVIGRQAAGGNHTVQVWMMHQGLSPRVQHAQEADNGTEVLGIGGHLQKRGGAGPEQETVDDLLVVECQRRQLMRECEDHMHVGNVEQFLAAGSQPLFACVGLAFWTMTITTSNGELSITCLMGSLF